MGAGMAARKRVAVIGGGVSGLAAARAFTARGHEVQGFERSAEFGGVWAPSRSYPEVQTQSPKDLYRFTDAPMPADYPEWPKGPQVHAYLREWAVRHDLERRFALGVTVAAMRRAEAGWTLTLEGARQGQERFDFVAVCTGQFSDPRRLTHPGQEGFPGHILHSSEYLDPALARGARVIVLGGSKSATDIAVNAANNGAASVHLVYPRNVWRIPYFVGGINFKHLLYMRAQEIQFNGWGEGAAARALRALTRPLVWANFRGLEALLKLQLGLGRHGMVPDEPIEKTVSCSAPIVTPGFFEALRAGLITPVKGAIARYDGAAAVLSTGAQVEADLVVQAVGWELGAPFLSAEDRALLVEPDGQYRLHRISVNPDLPHMGFVGYNSTFCTVLSSQLIAEWLVRYMDGALARQPDAAAMRADIEANLAWRRRERPAAQVYGGLCAAPFHFRHFDELLADMGCAERRRGWLAETFRAPDADAYARFLASAPQYEVA